MSCRGVSDDPSRHGDWRHGGGSDEAFGADAISARRDCSSRDGRRSTCRLQQTDAFLVRRQTSKAERQTLRLSPALPAGDAAPRSRSNAIAIVARPDQTVERELAAVQAGPRRAGRGLAIERGLERAMPVGGPDRDRPQRVGIQTSCQRTVASSSPRGVVVSTGEGRSDLASSSSTCMVNPNRHGAIQFRLHRIALALLERGVDPADRFLTPLLSRKIIRPTGATEVDRLSRGV